MTNAEVRKGLRALRQELSKLHQHLSVVHRPAPGMVQTEPLSEEAWRAHLRALAHAVVLLENSEAGVEP